MSYPQALGQIPWLRPAALVPGAVVAGAGVFAFLERPFSWGGLIAAGLFVAVGVTLSFRLWRMGVILHVDRIVVRGMFWSRTVPRERVLRVSRRGWLVSRTRSGRRWWTPITVFWNLDTAPLWFESHNGAALIRIRHWIERRESRPSQHLDDYLEAN